jgi:hypothetical protein
MKSIYLQETLKEIVSRIDKLTPESKALWGKMNPELFQHAALLAEAWSAKYKRSINCSNPKGFSQKAHCQGRKKKK